MPEPDEALGVLHCRNSALLLPLALLGVLEFALDVVCVIPFFPVLN